MRKFINGAGVDSTEDVLSYLSSHRQFKMANLYILQTAPNYFGSGAFVRNLYLGRSFYMTDWPMALIYGKRFLKELGTPFMSVLDDDSNPILVPRIFQTALIKRSTITSKIGLESDTLDVEWSPGETDVLATDSSDMSWATWDQFNYNLPNYLTGNVLLTALEGFRHGIFDNGELQVWRAIMPTEGDCNSLGATLIFSGRMGDFEFTRANVKIKVFSRMEVLNAQVPTSLIEPTKPTYQTTKFAYPEFSDNTRFSIVNGTVNKIVADLSGYTGTDNNFDGCSLVFGTNDSDECTKLFGTIRAIRKQTIEDGHHAFYVFPPLPFPPSPGDTLQVGTELTGSALYPYVPSPVSSAIIA